jgi:hypothetical protein
MQRRKALKANEHSLVQNRSNPRMGLLNLTLAQLARK